MLLGSLVNGAAILAGSAVGLFLRFILRRSSRRSESENGIGDRLQKIVMQGLALCTMYIGISGSLKLTITAPDSTELYAGNGTEAEDFTVNIPADGVYTISVDSRQAAGTLHIQRTAE